MSKRTLLAVFVAALAIRTAAALLHPPDDDGDQRLYRSLARSVAAHDGYVYNDAPETHVHPLLPILEAITLRAIPDDRTAALCVTLIIGSLLPVLAGVAVDATCAGKGALFAAALLVVQPHHVLASARVEPDLLAASLGFALAAALARGRWGFAGVFLGLGFLNRPEALLWQPAAAAFAWMRGASFRSVAGMVLIAAALACPFVLYVHAVEGRWTISGKDRWDYLLGVNQYRSGNQPIDPARIPELRRDAPSPLEHLASRPQEFFAGYAYRAWILTVNIGRQVGYGLLAPFAIAALVVGYRERNTPVWALLVALAALPVLPLVATFFRHSQPPAAVILALAGVGLARAMEFLREQRA